MIDTIDVLDELRALLAECDEPVATAPELADRLPVSRRTVLAKLDVLEAGDEIGSKQVGRTRVFWPLPLAEPPADPPEEPAAAESPPAEPPEEPPDVAGSASGDGELADVVDDVAGEWRPERRQQRREAALAALEWLRRTGGPAGKSDVVDALHDAHAVDGQSPRTWYRKNVRPAFNAARDRGLVRYDDSRRGYVWDG